MRKVRLKSIFLVLIAILAGKVFASILFGYQDYLPPNFQRGFLLGREEYFYGLYQYAFWLHLIVAPMALLLGTVLFLQGRGILKPPAKLHRQLGKLQAIIVLFGVVPSGLTMAWPGFIGVVAASGLVGLGMATAGCMIAAIQQARCGNYSNHEKWATRCFILLLSPLLLRVINGGLITFDLESGTILAITNWFSWIVPLVIHESFQLERKWMYPESSKYSEAIS